MGALRCGGEWAARRGEGVSEEDAVPDDELADTPAGDRVAVPRHLHVADSTIDP